MKEGMVIKSTGSWYVVYLNTGQTVNCRLRGQYRIKGIRTTNPLAVGDKVSIIIEPDQETGVIQEIHDRHNYIIRKATRLSKSSHIIAANLDQALLVATIDQPRTSTGFIDRFLVTAEAYHIPAVIAFNKTDLYFGKTLDLMNELVHWYSGIGYTVLTVSVLSGEGLDDFKHILQDKITLLSGHSGVGKTALINAIDSDLHLRIGAISDAHNKGKHTTTFAEMYPLKFGGWIVDTPGIKEFGLHELEQETLAQRFPEMRERMNQCHFDNCTHLHEPGCSIKTAVENGEIAGFRYLNYLHMFNNDDLPEN